MKIVRNRHISVIIPSWNGLEFLKTCLPSLKKQTFKNFEVIVVDNGSTDGSSSYITTYFPSYRVIKLEKNYGFAKAVNIGIKQSEGDYIFLLNNDTEVHKECLKYLIQAFKKNPEASFISAKMLNYYKRDLIDNAGDQIDASGHLIVRGLNKKDGPEFNKACPLFLATGGGTLIKKRLFNPPVGGFDEDFFFYMEDADFFFRAQLMGFKGFFEPKAKIYHVRMGTSSKNPKLSEYLVFKNMMMVIIKNFPLKLLLHNFNWLKIILVNLNTVRYLALKGMFLEALKAEFEIILSLPKLLKKRAGVQRKKKVSDQYIIDNVLEKRLI